MGVQGNLVQIRTELEGLGVELVAVSKTKPVQDIMLAYETGHRHFGENKVQELVAKAEDCPHDIKWHMIGHLQRNKVKYIVPFVHLIHGVDSIRLAKEINKQAKKIDRVQNVLLQVHISDEDTKFGFDQEELLDFLSNEARSMSNLRFNGLMGMASNTNDSDKVRLEFKMLKSLFEEIGRSIELDNLQFDILSMGMSGDYKLAIEEGSNMIRVGSSIFGKRG